MTENIPPVPPAPHYPTQPPEGYREPAPRTYASPGYDQQPYPQQTYPPLGRGQQPYPQQRHFNPFQTQQYALAGQWTPAGPPRPKSSGFRVASGIVEIVLGSWLLIPSIAGFQYGPTAFMAFLILVAALGNITAGIVLLANQRGRTPGPPITSLSFAGFTLLLGLIGLAVTYFGAALFVSSIALGTPVLIVMGIGLSRERRGA